MVGERGFEPPIPWSRNKGSANRFLANVPIPGCRKMAILTVGIRAPFGGESWANWAVVRGRILTPRKKNDERFRASFAAKIALT